MSLSNQNDDNYGRKLGRLSCVMLGRSPTAAQIYYLYAKVTIYNCITGAVIRFSLRCAADTDLRWAGALFFFYQKYCSVPDVKK